MNKQVRTCGLGQAAGAGQGTEDTGGAPGMNAAVERVSGTLRQSHKTNDSTHWKFWKNALVYAEDVQKDAK